jgi:hypothetical protein
MSQEIYSQRHIICEAEQLVYVVDVVGIVCNINKGLSGSFI